MEDDANPESLGGNRPQGRGLSELQNFRAEGVQQPFSTGLKVSEGLAADGEIQREEESLGLTSHSFQKYSVTARKCS